MRLDALLDTIETKKQHVILLKEYGNWKLQYVCTFGKNDLYADAHVSYEAALALANNRSIVLVSDEISSGTGEGLLHGEKLLKALLKHRNLKLTTLKKEATSASFGKAPTYLSQAVRRLYDLLDEDVVVNTLKFSEFVMFEDTWNTEVAVPIINLNSDVFAELLDLLADNCPGRLKREVARAILLIGGAKFDSAISCLIGIFKQMD